MSSLKRTSPRVCALVVCALAGAFVSGSLLAEHGGGWQVPAEQSVHILGLCGSDWLPGATCADVINSPWGAFDFYLGSRRIVVPTSFFGVAYFISIAIWFTLLGSIPPHQRFTWNVTAAFLAIGLAGSMTLLAVMALRLESWCPACVVVHGLNLLTVALGFSLWRQARQIDLLDNPARSSPQPPSMIAQRFSYTAGAACMASVVGLWLYYDAASESQHQWRKVYNLRRTLVTMRDDPGFMLREYFAQPTLAIPNRTRTTSSSEPFAEAPHLVIFTDYDSKTCSCFEGTRRSMIEPAFLGKLAVEYRYFDSNSKPEWVDRSSLAAIAARRQTGELSHARLQQLLYRRPSHGQERNYRIIATSAGLDPDRLLSDMRLEEVSHQLEEDSRLAHRLGVSSVPAAFLGGRRVPELCLTSKVFWEAIAESISPRENLAMTASSSPTP